MEIKCKVPVIVNLICHLDWAMGTQTFGQSLFSVCLWGCFWMMLTLDLVDRAKQIAFLSVSGSPPVSWGPELVKKADPPTNKRKVLFPDCLELWHLFFPAFGLELKHWLFLALESASIWTKTTPFALLGLHLADCRSGLVSLCSCMSQFLIISK